MNKLLKVLFAVEFILILAVIALSLVNNEKTPTAYVVKENPVIENADFKVFTKAVCEEKDEHLFCSDRLFVKCNEKEHIVDDNNFENFTECNNLRLNLSDTRVKGSALFRKEWADPRSSIDDKNLKT